MMTKIQVGNRYEVKPKNFHRAIVGKVIRVNGDKIFFEMETCDLVDRDIVKENELIEADIFDVKKQLSNQYFFS